MLELKNVKKSYDGTVVLKDISLDIGEGELVSILGPSGCGKTTRPEEIIERPENNFVKKFILNQLEIKRNNIYTLFAGQLQARAQVC